MSWIMKNPAARLVVSVLLVGFFAYAAVKLWLDDVKTPDDPVPMALDEAVEHSKEDSLWVSLQDTEELYWDCNSIVYWDVTVNTTTSSWMDIILIDPDESLVLVVDYSDQMSCEDLLASEPGLSGELAHMDEETYDYKNYEGRLEQYPSTAAFLHLCTFCDPNKSDTIIVISLVCMVGSVGMGLSSLYPMLKKRRQAGTPPGAVPASILEADPDYRLMQVFDFTQDDLETNMLGSLSPRQKTKLAKGLKWYVGLIIVLGIGGGCIALFLSGMMDDETNLYLLIGAAAALILGPIVAWLDYRSGRRIRRGKVVSHCGAAVRQIQKMGDTILRKAKLDGEEFYLDESQYAALSDGSLYCFYYIEGVHHLTYGSRRVVSVKRM
jgi:hypothetical protein